MPSVGGLARSPPRSSTKGVSRAALPEAGESAAATASSAAAVADRCDSSCERSPLSWCCD